MEFDFKAYVKSSSIFEQIYCPVGDFKEVSGGALQTDVLIVSEENSDFMKLNEDIRIKYKTYDEGFSKFVF